MVQRGMGGVKGIWRELRHIGRTWPAGLASGSLASSMGTGRGTLDHVPGQYRQHGSRPLSGQAR